MTDRDDLIKRTVEALRNARPYLRNHLADLCFADACSVGAVRTIMNEVDDILTEWEQHSEEQE